ncbi:hypothetical protein [Jatrophihabitans sp.]|nr:hypothetical protein [Jatrophihabitans sp.]
MKDKTAQQAVTLANPKRTRLDSLDQLTSNQTTEETPKTTHAA